MTYNHHRNQSTRVLCLGVILLIGIPAGSAYGQTDRFSVESQPGQVMIHFGDRPLATYVYQDPEISRPYFKDVHAPGEIRVTRNHPPREGVDPTDHATFHPGLWLAFGDLSGADSWRNKTPVRHVEFIERPHILANAVRFSVRNLYHGTESPVCEEICEYVFVHRPQGILLLWNSVFQSKQADFAFGDQEEMGLGIRLATPISVKSEKGGRIIDNEGRKNEKEIWGKQALWCDYSGWIDGSFSGLMIMPDPGNFRPCRWHVRDYGFLAANPFGQHVFGSPESSKVTVTKGQPFRLSYGILIHADKKENEIDFPAAYKDYLDILQKRRTGQNSKGLPMQTFSKPGLNPDSIQNRDEPKVLMVIGDGAEVLDTMIPFFRLGEDYRMVVAGPEKRSYHLVIHEQPEGWDITEERPGYRLDAEIAFGDVKTDEYMALVLPGGRAPEYLRYDPDLMRITRDFFAKDKPVASICHGIEILATADVIRGREVTTIAKCRFDAQVCGAEYKDIPVVRSGNLICARGKKDMSPWMKQFNQMIREYLAHNNDSR